MKHEYFPEELITLQEEVSKHTPLLMLFANKPSADLGERLADICHYVGWPIDTILNEQEVRALASRLSDKLYEMRTSILITH